MRTLIRNARIVDGTGRPAFSGALLMDGERIAAVTDGEPGIAGADRVVDAAGATVMPGLIEPHAHLTFADKPASWQLGEIPPEEHALIAARHAGLLLDHGFTSCFSAASAKPRTEIALRDAIVAGHVRGPRLLAASPELTVTGGLGDAQLGHQYRESFAMVCDGPEELRAAARMLVREGVDTLKVNISGDEGTPAARAHLTVMSDAEVAAVCEVARAHGRRMAAHTRSAESVKIALRHGIDVLYHATLVDEEALGLLAASRHRVFVAPTLGAVHATLTRAHEFGVRPPPNLGQEFELGCAAMRELKRRGVAVLPGGDYGFAWNPQGTDARDLAIFVEFLGFTPLEAIRAATSQSAGVLGLAGAIGCLAGGCIADVIVVEGDPSTDVSQLQDAEAIVAVFLSGRQVKAASGRWAWH